MRGTRLGGWYLLGLIIRASRFDSGSRYMKRTPLRRYTPLRPKKPWEWWKKPKTLAEQLWEVFAKFIKKRDRYTCFTCGTRVRGKNCHAGHFIASSVGGLALRYNEYNVHVQCYDCNILKHGNLDVYKQKMIEKYGQAIVDELWRIKYQVITRESDYPFEEKIAHYKVRLKAM